MNQGKLPKATCSILRNYFLFFYNTIITLLCRSVCAMQNKKVTSFHRLLISPQYLHNKIGFGESSVKSEHRRTLSCRIIHGPPYDRPIAKEPLWTFRKSKTLSLYSDGTTRRIGPFIKCQDRGGSFFAASVCETPSLCFDNPKNLDAANGSKVVPVSPRSMEHTLALSTRQTADKCVLSFPGRASKPPTYCSLCLSASVADSFYQLTHPGCIYIYIYVYIHTAVNLTG